MHRPRSLHLASILSVLLLALFTWPQPAAAQTRIMPLGDSITGSPGCWRALLWNRLQSTGFTNIDFVGTLPPQGCGVAYDGDNEGHGGFLATNVADQNLLPGWLSATRPDIVIMHFGTNDVWSARTPAQILAAFSKLVDQMRASNPNMRILVAQIIPLAPSGCADCPQRAIDFNAAIPAWAAGKSTSASPIVVVDQWTGFNPPTDTNDGVHPNDGGIVKIANKWYPPLTQLLTKTSSGSAPDVSGSSTANGAVVRQWRWTGGTNQQWRFQAP
jgi:lysophospholipase L1-like esterase